MKKLIWLLSSIVSSLFAQSYPYFISDKHGFMPNNIIDIRYSSLLMNDSVDILGLKESQVSTALEASMGDFKGDEIALRFRIYDEAMLGLKYEKTNINYGFGEVNNKKIDFFLRHNIISKVFALDIGIEQNSADDININELSKINSMIQRLNSNYHIVENPNPRKDNLILQNKTNNTFVPLDKTPFVSFEEQKDQTLYIRGIRSFVEDGFYSYDIFAGYGYTEVNSYLNTSIAQETNPSLVNFLENQNLQAFKKLDHNEHKLFFGVNHSWFVNHWFMDIGYEFNYIKRDKNLNSFNTNHKIDVNLGYEVFEDTIFYFGAKIMTNQFVGEIPYLYNEYTQSSFSKKYGWAKAGIIVKF